jgi:multicomponent Na+:H+ antiporter subunit B
VSRRGRLTLFGVAAAGLAVVLVLGMRGLPAFGHAHAVAGRVIEGSGVAVRHATDLITELNFDVRAFDTLGEEFILFASVLGITLILRQIRGEETSREETSDDEHQFTGASEALRALSLCLVPSLLAAGAYIVVHGQITPGGGFQGGIILAASPISVFIAGRYLSLKLIAPDRLIELGEAIGAGGYALLGLSGLVFTGIFLKNTLPLGMTGHLLSGGQLDVASVLVGLEVSGAFLVAWSAFLDQAVVVRGGEQG